MRVAETNGNGIGNNQNGSSNAIFVAVLPSLLLILNKKIKDIYREIEGRIGKGRENDGNVNNTPSEPSFPTRPKRSDEMTIKPLDKLRAAACADFCQETIEALGMRCDGFTFCEDCKRARDEATGKLVADIERRLMPEGMAWPRFEDGSPARIGDRVQLCNGHSEELCQVHMGESGYSLYTETSDEDHPYGVPVRRPEPEDTQERIDEDTKKTPCEYFGRKGMNCESNGGCPALKKPCFATMTKELLRRQRELDAKGAGRC